MKGELIGSESERKMRQDVGKVQNKGKDAKGK